MEFGQVVCTDTGTIDDEGQGACERLAEWQGEGGGEGASPT